MCDLVQDSRGAGWLCCQDNTWHPASASSCRICRTKHSKKTQQTDSQSRDTLKKTRGKTPRKGK